MRTLAITLTFLALAGCSDFGVTISKSEINQKFVDWVSYSKKPNIPDEFLTEIEKLKKRVRKARTKEFNINDYMEALSSAGIRRVGSD